jgi:hypothetical protein
MELTSSSGGFESAPFFVLRGCCAWALAANKASPAARTSATFFMDRISPFEFVSNACNAFSAFDAFGD